jgi:O-antigen/teichoic acid export membrane protein
VASGLTSIVLSLLLVPRVGIYGAALTKLITYLLLESLVVARMVKYGYKIRECYDLRSLGRFIVGAVAMSLVVVVFRRVNGGSLAEVLEAMGMGVTVYFAVLMAIGGFKFRKAMSAS